MSDSPYGAGAVAPGSSYRFAGRRGGTGGKAGTYYPDPFFDIAQSYMPKSVSQLYRWCRFYAMTNPLISAVLYKVSSYPITEVLYDTQNEGLKERYRKLFEDHLKVRPWLVEVNLDRNTYGNSFVSVSFPFRKYLRCKECGVETPINRSKYRYRNYEFIIECPKCHYHGAAKPIDRYTRSLKGIRLIRWNPENIRVKSNDLTGQTVYYYTLPRAIKNDIITGRPSTIENIPQAYITAVRKKKAIVFRPDQVYHMKRPSISRPDSSLGVSMLLPVLKDVFYLQVLKKAQEAIFFGYITPMRVLFPQAQSADSSPYSFVNLANWKDQIMSEIQAHRQDSNYIPVLPLPVGLQNVGGEGKALMLANEIRIWSEWIISGMGVPQELVFGGLSWSGSNVSLRMLENEFLGTREDTLSMLRFIRDKVAAHMGWTPVDLRLRPFKMADDLQRAAFDLQLAGQKFISKKTMLETRDYDYKREHNALKGEELDHELELQRKTQEHQAETQGKAQLILTKYQAESQKLMQEMMPQQAGVDPNTGQPVGPDGQPVDPATGQPMPAAGQVAGDPNMPGHPGYQDPNAAAQPGQPQGEGMPPAGQTQFSSVGGSNPIVGLQSPLTAQNMGNPGVDLNEMANSMATKISAMPPEAQGQALGQLKMQSIDLYAQVIQIMNSPQAAQALPVQAPPQREAAQI